MKKNKGILQKTRNVMKKIICMLLAIVSLCSVMTIPAFAASTTGFDILSSSNYAKTYTLSRTGTTTPYTNKYLNTPGTTTYGASSYAYIDNSADELYIMPNKFPSYTPHP